MDKNNRNKNHNKNRQIYNHVRIIQKLIKICYIKLKIPEKFGIFSIIKRKIKIRNNQNSFMTYVKHKENY